MNQPPILQLVMRRYDRMEERPMPLQNSHLGSEEHRNQQLFLLIVQGAMVKLASTDD